MSVFSIPLTLKVLVGIAVVLADSGCRTTQREPVLNVAEMITLRDALEFDDVNVVHSYLRRGVAPNAVLDFSGGKHIFGPKSLLNIAVAARAYQSVKLLLSSGACKDRRDTEGNLPIEMAVALSSLSGTEEITRLLSREPPRLRYEELMMHLVVITLGKCYGHIPEGIDAPHKAFRLFVNGQRLYDADLQREIQSNRIPILLVPEGSDEGRLLEIIFTLDGISAFNCEVRVSSEWIPQVTVPNWWGRIDERYGYWIFERRHGN